MKFPAFFLQLSTGGRSGSSIDAVGTAPSALSISPAIAVAARAASATATATATAAATTIDC